ncbi:MAG: PorP/SprF family type IX secretion system membrane protein [Cyclobacteriaceae bacterium]|nr:PorP/SprF family type IX secretion system membrane protein [Cyclobacteriaceae bacterium]
MKNILYLLAMLWLGQLYGQGNTSNQYMFNPLPLNPAFTGYFNVLSASSQFRFQTVGVDGAPVTQTIGLHSPLPSRHAAVGMQVWNETIGVARQSGLMGSYAYRIKTGGGLTLASGIQGGVKIDELNYTALRTRQRNDPTFTEYFKTTTPVIGIGILAYTDRAYAGLSLPELMAPPAGNLIARRPLVLVAGYRVDLNERLSLKPNLLVRMVDNELVEINLNTSLIIQDVLGLGVSYGFNDVIAGLVQLHLTDQLWLGYSFQGLLGTVSFAGAGSHEIALHYLFRKSRKNSHSPRYF